MTERRAAAGDSPTLSSAMSDGLYSVFQPVVELDSRSVVGFEALLRGPSGTWLERPDQLFGEARRLGLVRQLDWAARERAVAAARGGGLHLPVSLFVNAEPDALGFPGEAEHWRSFGDLRCYTEITERALAYRPSELLRSIDRIREQDWGIALDDIGAVPESLALMPLLRPDVLKLDMRLLAGRPDDVSSIIVHAVMAQAGETGAAVVAEGIETEEQLDLARGYGADLGQGYLLGRPAPLPQHIQTPGTAVPLLQRVNDKSLWPSPFAVMVDATSTRELSRPTMLELLRQLLIQAAGVQPAAILLMQLPDGDDLTAELLSLLEVVAQRSPLAVVFGGGPAVADTPKLRVAPAITTDGDPAAAFPQDLSVCVLSPFYAGALAGRPSTSDHTTATATFHGSLLFDRATCIKIATLLFVRIPAVADAGPHIPDEPAVQHVEGNAPTSSP